jgi:hypothetical protein
MKSPEGYIKVHVGIDPDDYNKLFNYSLLTETTIQKIIRKLIKDFIERRLKHDGE